MVAYKFGGYKIKRIKKLGEMQAKEMLQEVCYGGPKVDVSVHSENSNFSPAYPRKVTVATPINARVLTFCFLTSSSSFLTFLTG